MEYSTYTVASEASILLEEEINETETQAENTEKKPVNLREFVKKFTKKRKTQGLTQKEVGVMLGAYYGFEFSQATISRFEKMTLNYKMMSKLKDLLEKWFKSIEDNEIFEREAPFDSTTAHRLRRRRIVLEDSQKKQLRRYFEENKVPTQKMIRALANEMNLDFSVVRNWFGNRRQEEKRLSMMENNGFHQP